MKPQLTEEQERALAPVYDRFEVRGDAFFLSILRGVGDES